VRYQGVGRRNRASSVGCASDWAYSKVDRDPRGRTITVAYLAVIDEPVAVTGQDDAAKAEWWPLSDLPHLAFDHYDIMQDAIRLI
jgi:8-oxo-dGTP diphosphatase